MDTLTFIENHFWALWWLIIIICVCVIGAIAAWRGE